MCAAASTSLPGTTEPDSVSACRKRCPDAGWPDYLVEAVRLIERPHVGMTVALAAGLSVASEPDGQLIEKFVNETPLSESFRESLRGRL